MDMDGQDHHPLLDFLKPFIATSFVNDQSLQCTRLPPPDLVLSAHRRGVASRKQLSRSRLILDFGSRYPGQDRSTDFKARLESRFSCVQRSTWQRSGRGSLIWRYLIYAHEYVRHPDISWHSRLDRHNYVPARYVFAFRGNRGRDRGG